MVDIVEGLEIGCRCWNVGASSPPVGMRNLNIAFNGRKQHGCVTFKVPMTLHFNTSKGKEEEEHHHT